MSNENKTHATSEDAEEFINKLPDPLRRNECTVLLNMMKNITGEEPRIWSGGLVGFGNYRYKYNSGREGEWFITGFASRKQNLTIYVMPGFGNYKVLLDKLGKFRTSVSCLYVKTLDDINMNALQELIELAVKDMCKIGKQIAAKRS
jgi:hypothetical protein